VRAATPARISLVALVIATFLAIFYAQEVKREAKLLNEPFSSHVVSFQPVGPITRPHVTREAHFHVRATVDDTLAVAIVDERSGRTERVLVTRVHAYKHVDLTWNGRTATGTLAPPGRYRLSVHFERRDQTVTPTEQLALLGPSG
jgi:hypothetical protein